MKEILFQCEAPYVLVRFSNFKLLTNDEYKRIELNVEMKTHTFHLQKRIEGYMSELSRLFTDLNTLSEGSTNHLHLTLLGDYFSLELKKSVNEEIALTCGISCYEGTRDVTLEMEGSLKSNDMKTILSQVEAIIKELAPQP